MRTRVAAYKYPRHVRVDAALPKSPTGKILKREIAPPEITGSRPPAPLTPLGS